MTYEQVVDLPARMIEGTEKGQRRCNQCGRNGRHHDRVASHQRIQELGNEIEKGFHGEFWRETIDLAGSRRLAYARGGYLRLFCFSVKF